MAVGRDHADARRERGDAVAEIALLLRVGHSHLLLRGNDNRSFSTARVTDGGW